MQTALLVSILSSTIALAEVRAACPEGESACAEVKMATDVGRRYSLGENFQPDETVHSVEEDGSRYLRVRVHVEHPEDGVWQIAVRDENYHLIETLGPEDFSTTPDRWTVRIPGSKAFFGLDRGTSTGNVVIRFDHYIAMPANAKGTYYSLQGDKPRYVPLFGSSNGDTSHKLDRPIGETVGFLMSDYAPSTWSCSGVMVARDLFLTNWHCGAPPGSADAIFWKEAIVSETLIDVSWDNDTSSREYVATERVAYNSELDYALLRVSPVNAVGAARFARLNPSTPNGSIRIIHHPEAKQKQISTCHVIDATHASWRGHVADSDFTHDCDTEAGSSGAPVFDSSGAVIGLHHRGFLLNAACQVTERKNTAVRIDRILDDLRCPHRTVATVLAGSAWIAQRDAASPCPP